ncbi:Regulatory Protein SusR [Bacteroidales bacterium CF]|nr:Regulatory Protein SusR [Bacteroidales bacterium CF]
MLLALFETLKHKEDYVRDKEQRIEDIKKLLIMPDISDNQRYILNNRIQDEYSSYQIDSATQYLEWNMRLAYRMENPVYLVDTKLKLSFMYWQSGKFFEAVQQIASINRSQLDTLPAEYLFSYYNAYKRLYRYYAEAQNDRDNDYFRLSRIYADSLIITASPDTRDYQLWIAEKFAEENKTKEAEAIVSELLKNSSKEDHNRAILSSILANIYKKEGNVELQKKYYALSAIYDIKNAVKENTSMQSLALLLFKEGDIDNAYHCIQSSMEDAVFCNSRFRTYEITKIFPIIDSAYQTKAKTQKKELKLYLLLVSILSVLLVIAIIFVYRYMQRITHIRSKLSETNQDLHKSNEQMYLLNTELLEVNRKLSEASLLKDTYLTKFIDLCSHYIEKLDNYRRTLNRYTREGKMEELYSELRSPQFINNELNNFFTNFDETFLRLYPTFIEEFNALFPEGEKQNSKPGEILNTELRIYALIRLGINDSSQIALFLRFSITTVYTYRSKLKNKSLYKDSFEEQVMKIGR